MGLIYTANVEAIAVSAAQDLLTITAPADAVVRVRGVVIGQSSDYGDAEAEGLTVNLTRYAAAGTGTSVTPQPQQSGYPAAGSTVIRNATTQGTTPTVVHGDTFNVQAGWQYWPADEADMFVISPSAVFAVELPDIPTDAVTVSAAIEFEEIGG